MAPQPSVSMAGISIQQVKNHKHLGVIVNDTLTWSNHIDKVYERCAQRVGILRRLRRTFPPPPPRALRGIYVGTVLPIMEYACPVWSGGPVAKLIHLHESFCRRNQTSLPPLQKRHTLVLFYKMRKNLTPSCLSSLMPSPSSTSGYQFRREPYMIQFQL